jgi:hypothetical protein
MSTLDLEGLKALLETSSDPESREAARTALVRAAPALLDLAFNNITADGGSKIELWDYYSAFTRASGFDGITDCVTRAQATEERAQRAEGENASLISENRELRRKALPVGGTDRGERRAAASKLLCDICACAAEADPESMNLPHVVEGCVAPLEVLIAERDACLYLLQQAHKVHGRDVIDAIVEKAAAERRAQTAEAERDALKEERAFLLLAEQRAILAQQDLQARIRELEAGLERIADGSLFNQLRYAEEDDTDYFLRCYRIVAGYARSLLQQPVEGDKP